METPRVGLAAFDLTFDDHFNVRSAWIQDALKGKTQVKATTKSKYTDRCKKFPDYKGRPEAWGINVSLIGRLYAYIEADFDGYASAHCFSADFKNHVCLVEPCQWCHEGAPTVVRNAAGQGIHPMKPNMHLVVQRYIKPWTKDFGVGFALMMNAGHIARKSSVLPEDFCLAKVFISHCWNEAFQDFVRTLENSLDPQTVVWVCSLAIWQHGNIAGALSSLEECPFAIALSMADRVIAVTDSTVEAFKRCWVVLEAEIARKKAKPYNISLPEDGNLELWRSVGEQLGDLDVRTCGASCEDDKRRIMEYATMGEGGISGLNEQVQSIALRAMNQAKVMAIAMSGDVESLQSTESSLLGSWRSIRGMTATHIAAWHSRVGAVMEILARTGYMHTNEGDNDTRTPLSVAAEHGSLAAVQALLSARASPNIVSHDGLSPLHYAAQSESPKIVQALLEARADIEAECKYQGAKGTTAVIVAARSGNAGVIDKLAEWEADLESRNASGRTALTQAASWGYADTMAALIASRADVNRLALEEVERTPLMVAVLHCRYTAVCTLLGAGADMNARSSNGMTATEFCAGDAAKTNPATAKEIMAVLTKFQTFDDAVVEQRKSKRELLRLNSEIHHLKEDGGKHMQDAWHDPPTPFGASPAATPGSKAGSAKVRAFQAPSAASSSAGHREHVIREFQKFDATGSGYIKEATLRQVFEKLGFSFAHDPRLFCNIPATGDGQINYMAFFDRLWPPPPPYVPEHSSILAGIASIPTLGESPEPRFQHFERGFGHALMSFERTRGTSLASFVQERLVDQSSFPAVAREPFERGTHGKIYRYFNSRSGKLLALKVVDPLELVHRGAPAAAHWAYNMWGSKPNMWQVKPIAHFLEADDFTLEAMIQGLLYKDCRVRDMSIANYDCGICGELEKQTGYAWLEYYGFVYRGVAGTNLNDLGNMFYAALSGADDPAAMLQEQADLLFDIISSLLKGLQYLQDEYDFVHGDAKLKNIFVSGNVRCGPSSSGTLRAKLGDYGQSTMTYRQVRLFAAADSKYCEQMEALHASVKEGTPMLSGPESVEGCAEETYFRVPREKVGGVPLYWRLWRHTGLPLWKQLDIYCIILGLFTHPGFSPILEQLMPDLFGAMWVSPGDANIAWELTVAIREQTLPPAMEKSVEQLARRESVNILNHYVASVQRFRLDILDVVLRNLVRLCKV